MTGPGSDAPRGTAIVDAAPVRGPTGSRGAVQRPVHLIAVQARMDAPDYGSAEAFRARIDELARVALERPTGTPAGTPALPTLLAFPEAIGLPLPFALADPGVARALRDGRPLGRALGSAALRGWRRWLPAVPRAGLGALWHLGALEADAVVREVFQAVAVRYGVTVAAGSLPLPFVDREAALGDHVRLARVRNTAYLFGPDGRVLDRTEKVVPTALERRVGIRPGSLSDLRVAETPVGRVGTAICLDAFHRSVLEHFDACGAEIVLQPTANHAAWRRPWPPDPRRSEAEAWLAFGVRAGIRGCRSIRVAVNPMLVGDVGPLHARGRSTISVNPRLVGGDEAEAARPAGAKGADDVDARWPGLIALAPDAASEAVVRAVVDLGAPNGARGDEPVHGRGDDLGGASGGDGGAESAPVD